MSSKSQKLLPCLYKVKEIPSPEPKGHRPWDSVYDPVHVISKKCGILACVDSDEPPFKLRNSNGNQAVA